MSFPIWTDRKTVSLDHHELIAPRRSLALQQFAVPGPCPSLRFGALALSAAYGRTATLDRAPALLHLGERLSLLSQLLVTVANGSPFQLAPAFSFLNDDAAPTLAGRVGAAITDLYMSALGYVWRDNARSIAPASDPRADFIYSGGPIGSDGVVLAEAHGTFAMDASSADVRAKARKKYTRQIIPYLGVISPNGPVAHGYAVAFGSRPTSAGAFLAVAETSARATLGSPGRPPSARGVRRAIALASHRSNFRLMRAEALVSAIDYVEGAGPAPDDEQMFLRVSFGGRNFLVAIPNPDDAMHLIFPEYFSMPGRHRLLHGSEFFRYGMDEQCAMAILEQLRGLVKDRRDFDKEAEFSGAETLNLPEIEPIGLGEDSVDPWVDEGSELVVFRDGLAALRIAPGAAVEIAVLRWSFGARE